MKEKTYPDMKGDKMREIRKELPDDNSDGGDGHYEKQDVENTLIVYSQRASSKTAT